MIIASIISFILVILLIVISIINTRRLNQLQEDYWDMQRKPDVYRAKLIKIKDLVQKVDVLNGNPYTAIREIKRTINSDKVV